MSAAATPSTEICHICVPSKDYDELKRKVRGGRHNKRRPLRFQFCGDKFKTLIWIEGDTMFGKDPEHPEGREIHVMNMQAIATGEITPGSAKGLLMNAYCATVPEAGEDKDVFNQMLRALLQYNDELRLLTGAINAVKSFDGERKTAIKNVVVAKLCNIGCKVPLLLSEEVFPHHEEIALNYLRKIKELAEQMMA